MSDHPGRITPDEVGQRPAPFADCYIRTLRQLAARTLTGGVAGMKGSDYAGQGYVEVPSAWLAEILDRLAVAEAAIGAKAVVNAQAPHCLSLDYEEAVLFDDASKHMDAFLEESRRSASHNPASAYQAVRARLAHHPRVLEALSARFAASVAASDYLSTQERR